MTDQKFGRQSDSDQGFIKHGRWSMLIRSLLPETTKTPPTATAPATKNSVNPSYCMEEPDPSLAPHKNQSSSRHRINPPGNHRHHDLPQSDSGPSRGKPKSSNAQKLSTIGGRTTPSTPRPASPDSKGNDSSTSQRKSRPKPKPNGTSGIKESARNPAGTNPPPTKSDSRQPRSREKLDGDATDATDPKQPRREKETKPCQDESRVDSGSIHGSVDAELPLPEHGARRKRRGNFDRKLTTADDTPRREEHRANPVRGKYWVDYTADDLTSKLIHDLRTSPYLDCIICYNPIRPLQSTWSCSPTSPIAATEEIQGTQYCWVTLHLKCVRSWASKSISDTLQAYKARGENKPGDWLCIGCRAKRMIEPSSYGCVHCLFTPIYY